jgi:peptidoglycan hydrolase-like protein with peptidoglycan-binding domain
MRKGIDVSSNNHPGDKAIDWAAVKGDGIEWAAIKATEGVSYANPFYEADVLGAEPQGIEVVPYHFARPTFNTGGDEARAFANKVGPPVKGAKVALDLEDGRQLGWEWLAAWVRDFVSVKPVDLIYAPGGYFANLAAFGAPFGAEVWEVENSGGNPSGAPAVLQSGQGTVAGISGPVDLDVVNYAPAPSPGPTPAPEPPPGVAANVFVPELVAGSTGAAVANLQALLNRHGGTLAVDGEFGGATDTNVRQYQLARGLAVDGIVGPETWEHLLTT